MPLVGRELLDVTGASALPVPSAVTPLIDLRLDRLSGGQYQLLLVWACLGSSARLVLLDEPTNNMDPETVVALGEMLLAARDRGKGVLVVSHEAGLLDRVCSRIVEVAR
jgi:ATPase subunit of ABC transporter with duplicated ATPase domains